MGWSLSLLPELLIKFQRNKNSDANPAQGKVCWPLEVIYITPVSLDSSTSDQREQKQSLSSPLAAGPTERMLV